MNKPYPPTLEEQFARVLRDRRRVARERMVRVVAGDRWRQMVRITPVLFRREGRLELRALARSRDEVIAALREAGAVFAMDTAMRLARGYGFLKTDDVYVYISDAALLTRLANQSMVDRVSCADNAIVRPWPGTPRLIACVVADLPSHTTLNDGTCVVSSDRLRAELIGAVGLRADLFALAE